MASFRIEVSSMRRRLLTIIPVLVILSASVMADEIANYKIELVTDKLTRPYSMVFLPSGDMLVTEKFGGLRVISDGKLLPDPVLGVPKVFVEQYIGLMGIALHPQFASNRFLYLSFSHGTREANATRVVRGRYHNGRLEDVIDIFTAYPTKDSTVSFGAGMTFLPDNTLLITVGECSEYREQAQDLKSMLGKVVRVTDSGHLPDDNPFVDDSGARSPIWSYGHRHSQAILHDPVTGMVFAHEHGPWGGDELNVIAPGKNYGWPITSHGVDYSGAYITPYQSYPGMTPSRWQWTPSLAPSSLTQCRDCRWREWEGDLFIGMLAGKQVRRVRLQKGKVVGEQALFKELDKRIRHVGFGPDGALYILTDAYVLGGPSDAELLKVTPIHH